MNKQLYLQLRKEIQDKCPECRKHIGELDSLFHHLAGKDSAPTLKVLEEINTTKLPTQLQNESLGYRQAIRMVLGGLAGEITPLDVANALLKNSIIPEGGVDRIKINANMKKMKEFIKVREGAGRIPATYRKK